MNWVIIGCGYTGERLAAVLVGQGSAVTVTRRSAADAGAIAARLGCDARAADLSKPSSLSGWIPAHSIVAVCAPPGEPPGRGEAALVGACASAGTCRIVYVSSTGVYPEGGGAWIDEDVAPDPVGAHGRRRLEAETSLLTAAATQGLEAVSLRAAGIYGAGRGMHVRLAAGDYRVIGDGATFVNRIHVDDLVGAILAAAEVAALRGRIYNVADDEPVTSRQAADAVAGMLGLPPPPSIPLEQASEMARAMMRANRRISNARLKAELGWSPRYPTYREGVPAAIASGQ